MPTSFSPKVITANALLSGDVVYLTAGNTWSPRLSEADVLSDEADAQIRLIEASARVSEVVGVYLADVAPAADGPRPTHFREAFRMRGPSNYPHGKQSEVL